jgi:hypothetical protein
MLAVLTCVCIYKLNAAGFAGELARGRGEQHGVRGGGAAAGPGVRVRGGGVPAAEAGQRAQGAAGARAGRPAQRAGRPAQRAGQARQPVRPLLRRDGQSPQQPAAPVAADDDDGRRRRIRRGGVLPADDVVRLGPGLGDVAGSRSPALDLAHASVDLDYYKYLFHKQILAST